MIFQRPKTLVFAKCVSLMYLHETLPISSNIIFQQHLATIFPFDPIRLYLMDLLHSPMILPIDVPLGDLR